MSSGWAAICSFSREWTELYGDHAAGSWCGCMEVMVWCGRLTSLRFNSGRQRLLQLRRWLLTTRGEDFYSLASSVLGISILAWDKVLVPILVQGLCALVQVVRGLLRRMRSWKFRWSSPQWSWSVEKKWWFQWRLAVNTSSEVILRRWHLEIATVKMKWLKRVSL